MKKLLSMILCLCMILSLLPISVGATGNEVTTLTFTVDEPQPGQKPADLNVNLKETDFVEITEVGWSTTFGSVATFERGNDYTVFVEVGVKDPNSEFKEKLSTLTLNEKNATLYSKGADKKSIVACYTFVIPNVASAPTPAPAPAPTPAPAPSTSTGFADVADNAYYADAVKWAVEKGITSGTSATTFSSDDTCTKAQVLTFMWRAVGSPKHEGVSKFLDMSEADYYYHAVHWAQSKKMISGPKFNSNEPCTRGTVVFYLWKLAGSPRDMYSHSSQFTDLPFGSDTMRSYIGWAVAEGITSGTSETTFSPDATCTRGQIVTFLQRAFKQSGGFVKGAGNCIKNLSDKGKEELSEVIGLKKYLDEFTLIAEREITETIIWKEYMAMQHFLELQIRL